MTLTADKIEITGIIETKTGLHIGGDTSFAAIGAIDLAVVRDSLTNSPIIPGSTIKGKLRTLLAREKGVLPEKGVKGFEGDPDEVVRLFGTSKKKTDTQGTGIQQSRLMFKDAFLVNEEKLPQVFETKFENTIDRLTAEANPRQIERVIRGAKFDLCIIYNVENLDEVEEDFANLQTAIDLLRFDYLGGGGTRGNGRVEFADLRCKQVTGKTAINVPELK